MINNTLYYRHKNIAIIVFLFFLAVPVFGQRVEHVGAAIEYLQQSTNTSALTKDDLKNVKVSDYYIDQLNGIAHIYLQQTYAGVPIENAINAFYISPDMKIGQSGNRFYAKVASKISPIRNKINARSAVISAADFLGIDDVSSLRKESQSRSSTSYEADFSVDPIAVKEMYILDNEKLKLVYSIPINETGVADYWNMMIEAETGKVLRKDNLTIYCEFDSHPLANQNPRNSTSLPNRHLDQNNQLTGERYRVYALPIENPNDGNQIMVSEPQITVASPFGWHDTDGVPGAEYTITRGNNVHAYEDGESNNRSLENEPNGGNSLYFSFLHLPGLDPVNSEDAAITNLFYTNNMAHDLSYLLGFTEAAGNFQHNNYGNPGLGNDYVRAEGFDGSGRNNANFSITPDGARGRMQMFLFDKVSSYVDIESPDELAQRDYETGGASFGPALNTVNIEAAAAVAITVGFGGKYEGCDDLISDVAGKVALIDRGGCDFSLKAYQAQKAGAVMAIVCNIPEVDGGTGEEIIVMGGGERAADVTIPAAFMKKSDCDLIKIAIDNGKEVLISARDRPIDGPRTFDSNFDNGIILHEYGHGISTRLTGGPSQPGCLPTFRNSDGSNPRGEQMGEGWSDFFGLVWTTKPGDSGATPRGIGTYVSGEESTGRGIRSFPFTTDMNINPLTYDDIKIASVPHGVGAVWASALWDMYWRFIEIYGFDEDWSNVASGNYRATYLVMEGMKLQPCRPGFIDGRDAILEADKINYNGMHERMIWEVFARRGVGYFADQGSSNDHRDGTEDFSIPPLMIQELKIAKSGSNHAIPGKQISARITVTNHIPNTQNDVIIEDFLPAGLTYVNGSSPIAPTLENDRLIFSLGTMEYLEEVTLEYRLLASQDITSTQLYYEDVEKGENGWSSQNLRGTSEWIISANRPLSGSNSWYSAEIANEENTQILLSPPILIMGERPTFRFWHRHEVSPAVNGGYVEISNDGGETWKRLDDNLTIRNQYPGQLSFFAFAIPELAGFSGSSGKYLDTYIDLQEYKDQEVQFRFLFANTTVPNADIVAPGWYIDDLELIDLSTYTTQACTYSNEDPEQRCTESKVIVVNTNTITNTIENEFPHYRIKVFPNPVDDFCLVNLANSIFDTGTLYIISTHGQMEGKYPFSKKEQSIQLDFRNLNSGVYILLLHSGDKMITHKISVTH